MRKLFFAGLLVFAVGCFRKSPSQNYEITSDTFKTVYITLVELSQAGYLSVEDMNNALVIRNSAKPILDEYAEMVKKDPKNPSLEWIAARLRMFLIDLSALESKGKKHREEARSNLLKIIEGTGSVPPLPSPEKKAEVIRDRKEM